MVSMLHTSLSLEERKPRAMNNSEKLLSSKKRKWEETEGGEEEDGRETSKSFKSAEAKPNSFDHIELQIDTPLPLEWQRCLDIKSGQIHFYNTRTHKRTSKDPRKQNQTPEPSLDLELNLTCKSTEKTTSPIEAEDRCSSNSRGHKDDHAACELYRPSPSPPPVESRQQEMVAGVCMRCHMLVMMCKAAPSCPNCKFVYPSSSQCSSLLLKPSSGLSLC